MNYTLKVTHNNKKVVHLVTTKKKRFLCQTGTINWRKRNLEVYIKVYYNKGEWNEGIYTTRKEFDLALKAFLELPE